MTISSELKAEAIRLRQEERLSITEIQERTGLSRGTLSVLLSNLPLTGEEIVAKRLPGVQEAAAERRYRPKRSKLATLVAEAFLSRERKGHIAEAAVLLRLAIFDYQVFKSEFDGCRVDWLVTNRDGNKYARL